MVIGKNHLTFITESLVQMRHTKCPWVGGDVRVGGVTLLNNISDIISNTTPCTPCKTYFLKKRFALTGNQNAVAPQLNEYQVLYFPKKQSKKAFTTGFLT